VSAIVSGKVCCSVGRERGIGRESTGVSGEEGSE